ncbi:MAG: hypothetical protein GY778_26405 [bacterium]|nr:hypothetical protein [bacterium]
MADIHQRRNTTRAGMQFRRLRGRQPVRICGLIAMLGMYPAGVTASDDLLVQMTGGAAPNGEEYAWTVTNLNRSPIVGLTIPCYRAGMFRAPARWTARKEAAQDAAVAEPGTQVYVFAATSPAAHIAWKQSGEFAIRLKPGASVQRTPGNVHIRFADGTDTVLLGIELPQPESAAEKQVWIIGLATMFAVFIGVQIIRHRRRNRAAEPAPAEPPPTPEA